MALYAKDEENYIFAPDATSIGTYRCLECSSSVRVRRGKNRQPHFYHLQKSPTCRLYSKTEDHLLIQLQLQKLLQPAPIQIEVPIRSVHRVADLLWEEKKFVFEIQCSKLDLSEAGARIADYRKAGYEIIWLLDDRLFNRQQIRPAEIFLRQHLCYFFSFNRLGMSTFYDQLEIVIENKRCKKSPPLKVQLSRSFLKPQLTWPQGLPSQIEQRIALASSYFQGDLLDRTIRSALQPAIAETFKKWRQMEADMQKAARPTSPLIRFLKNWIQRPYEAGLDRILQKLTQ